MNRSKAEKILVHAHGRKHRYESRNAALRDVHRLKAKGEQVSAYRCCFSSLTGGEHFHVGHPPGVESMFDIAEAIRWFHEHGLEPDENP